MIFDNPEMNKPPGVANPAAKAGLYALQPY
jgi:hypothetical protein